MTEASFANTHPNAHPFPVTAPALSPPSVNGTHSVHVEGEEPYTIKCICIYGDDDGSTVFCERCETWQHIVCYYDDQEVPDIHNCADCEPRALDAKSAIERQKRIREQKESGDRKGKRTGTKTQKKKVKDAPSAIDTPNGWSAHDRSASNSVARDHPPPAKKSRTTHRSSASVSSVAGALALDSKKRGASSAVALPSPTKIPTHPPIPLYSQEFLHLYDNDEVNTNMHGNLFDTLGLAGDLASWVQDPSALGLVANGRASKDVFTYSDQPLDSSTWPVISKQSVTDTSVEFDGRHPTWQFLKVAKDVRKDEIVGEVRGKVGHFRDYCLDPNSRWQELRHPEPFVFFHPQLPIYIDSRKEGTLLRYIRRSCRPNVTLKTFITNEIEYHFCFVANRDIPHDSEITTTWYLDPQLFPASNGFVKQDGPNDGIPEAAAISISNVLAHFGGCACDSSQPCLLANVDRRFRPRSLESTNKQSNGRRKKSRAKNNISPISTGRATNSRAGSEARKYREDEDQAENRSVSGSARGQPQSRDLTPTGHNPAEIPGTNGTELSAREKRKIAAAEKKFEQLEQDQQHASKKRRRNAGSTTSKSTGPSKPPRLDTMPSRRSPSTSNKASPKSAISRRESRSTAKSSAASTPRIGSPRARAKYVDTGIQTDYDEGGSPLSLAKHSPRPSFIPLTKRLLCRYRDAHLRLDASNESNDISLKDSMPPPPPVVSAKAPLSPDDEKDVEMKDADTSITPSAFVNLTPPSSSHEMTAPAEFVTKPDSSPLPSTLAHYIPVRHLSDYQPEPTQSPQQHMPDVPLSTPPATSSSPRPQEPSSIKLPAITATRASGLGITAPSPVKKRMSLNDYMSRRGNLAAPSGEKHVSPSPLSTHQRTPPVVPNPTTSINPMETGQTEATTNKPIEAIKHENDVTPDTVMKDVSSLPVYMDSSSNLSMLTRDPRLNPPT